MRINLPSFDFQNTIRTFIHNNYFDSASLESEPLSLTCLHTAKYSTSDFSNHLGVH